MDKELSPKAAILILLIFGSILFGIFWANGKFSSINGFSHLHLHPNGELFIQFDNELLAFGQNGTLTRQYNLGDFGIDGRDGDFAFFANGDLLIRNGSPSHGPLFNLMRFLRLRNPTPENSSNAGTGLMRCNLHSKQCESLKYDSLNLNDAHSLEIDWDTDHIFVADTSRHQVYLLDGEGGQLARLDKNLRFPNQIVYRDAHLYIANTNRQEISIYPVHEGSFGGPLEPIDVLTPEAQKNSQVWPASVMVLDEIIWVKSAQNGMSDGGVYRFERSGHPLSKIDLPTDADPYAMTQLGSTILITDFSRDRIYQADLEGGLKGEFKPQIIADRITKITKERKYYINIRTAFIGLFLMSFAIGIFFSLREGKEKIDNPPTTAGKSLNKQEIAQLRTDPRIHWIAPEKSREYKAFIWLMPILVLLPVSVLIPLFMVSENNIIPPSDVIPLSLMGLAFAGMLIAMTWFMLRLQRSRIGIYNQLLILVDHRGRTAVGKGPEIFYSNQIIAINNVVINLGQGAFRLFPLPELAEHVYPLLNRSVYLTNSQAASYVMKHTAQGTVIAAVAFVALAGILGYQFLS